ncbi:MAG TPA: DEAD/DEAH box helicase, partial [Isosphaeraceae bacterium]|nr:DEAD/DEAH box helicase [Isosphaeraceae bacterium]
MNPIDLANTLRNRFVSYLTTNFGLSQSLADFNREFERVLTQPGQLIAGPFLEATAPYELGKGTLVDLCEEGILHPRFRDLFAGEEAQARPAAVKTTAVGFGLGKKSAASVTSVRRERMPGDRKLYVHQEEALRRLCRDPDSGDFARHTVVASGTGSGKTECFLIPAIDWILRHPTRDDRGQPGAGRGLRALLVYPMNALVNDQVRRLRQLVGYWEGRGERPVPITFARYTSETKNDPSEAQQREPNAPTNQILTRPEIISNPPDILITNFAMLEQALLRPQEAPFFDDIDVHAWRFLILDEAHSYRGAQAIELARLMQRVRAAVRRGKRRLAGNGSPEPICMATSATLADPKADPEEQRQITKEFAGNLFGLDFGAGSVIFARRERPELWGDPWDFPDSETRRAADEAWAFISDRALIELDEISDDAFRGEFRAIATPQAFERATAESGDNRRAFLFHLLKGHPRFHWLWGRIRERPERFEVLADESSAADPEAGILALERLVAACNAARRRPSEQPLLPCRYHLFASALEGLYANLASDTELALPSDGWSVPGLGIRELAVHRIKPEDREAFELGRCTGCGYPFVVVDPNRRAEARLDQPPVWDRPVQFLAFAPDNTGAAPLEAVRLNLALGIRFLPGNRPPYLTRTLYLVPANSDGTDVKSCPNCGRDQRYQSVASRFMT